MDKRLFHEILMARQRVYTVCPPTPLERLNLALDAEVYLKREDLSPIHAYKWRGAYNRMALLTNEERARGVIAASAGNHAQGVALAARRLDVHARIFMPVSTPRMKQIAVHEHGGEQVEIVLRGDSYSDAAEQALAESAATGKVFIHPYDDYATMGGQGTLADEVVMSGKGPFDVAFIQIGGGGLAAAVSCWLKAYHPATRIIGVEGVDQASMAAAVRAGKPVALDYVDVFCDGTAVRKAGDLTFPLCRDLVDEFMTVTNEEVCAAIQVLWEQIRCVPEPAGAMGLAGLLKTAGRFEGKRILCLLCGANMDFGRLAMIARQAGIGARRRRYFRFEIAERSGTMLELLETALAGFNIIEFQYGKTHPTRAWPVIGFEASPPELDVFERCLRDAAIPYEDVTSQEDVVFRIINYDPAQFKNPFFIKLEFPERAGALHDFLAAMSGSANICYFNYAFTGEEVGRALMGFEFDSQDQRTLFHHRLDESGRSYREIHPEVLRRIL